MSQPINALAPSIINHPVHLLGVTLQTPRNDIATAAEVKALSADPTAAREALKQLTHPRLRLKAEVSWITGVSPERCQQLLGLKNDITHRDVLDGLDALSRANVLSWIFEARLAGAGTLLRAKNDLQLFVQAIDDIDVAAVTRIINEDRETSGFPAVVTDQMASAIQDRRSALLGVGSQVINSLSPNDARSVLLDLLDSSDDSFAVHELVERSEQHALPQLTPLLTRLETRLDRAESTPKTFGEVGLFCDDLKALADLTRPFMISRWKRGLEWTELFNVVARARGTAVRLANEWERFGDALAIVNNLQPLHYCAPDVESRLQADKEGLEQLIEDEKHAKSWSAPAQARHPASAHQPPASPPPSEPKGGSGWKWTFAIMAVVALIGFARSGGDADTSSQSQVAQPTATTAPTRTPTSQAQGQCGGIDEWWDETQDRVGRALDVYSSPSSTSLSSRQAQLYAAGIEQRRSSAPRAATAYSFAEVELIEFLADDLTSSASDFTWQQEYDRLNDRRIEEAEELATTCNFNIIWE